jgi:hypothetical protein
MRNASQYDRLASHLAGSGSGASSIQQPYRYTAIDQIEGS